MNLAWLTRNLVTSWRSRDNFADFARRLLLSYSARLPQWARRREWRIGFRYPPPIGRIRLVLRDNNGADSFIHSEVFEHEYYRLPLPAPPKTILDLGANIGLTTVYFSRLFPQAALACVEPIPGNLQLLRRNLDLNAVRSMVFAAAIDASDGDIFMELHSRDYGHMVAKTSSTVTRALQVEAISVPTVLRKLGWERIGLLKVDIEGHENVLFAGECTWLHSVKAMCIECHDVFGEADLKALASNFGFLPPQLLPGVWFLRRPA